MSRFIRLHPWRLEIVPTVAVSIAIAHVLSYYLSGAATLVSRIMRQSQGPVAFERAIFFLVGLMLLHWSIEMSSNHSWVESERRKKFHYFALLLQVNILMWASLIIILMRFMVDATFHVQATIDWSPLPAMVIAGVVATAVLEWSRPFIPTDDSEPAPPSPYPGSNVYYSETQIEWPMAVGGPAVAALCAWCSDGGLGGWIAAGILAGLFVWLGRGKLEITDQQIRSSLALLRHRITLSEIRSLSAVSEIGTCWRRPRNVPRGQWRMLKATGHRCLEVVTKDGRIYQFGMLRPQYACSLIQPLIAPASHETT